ncbi:DNA methyltransferase, partial [Longimicrobium sp.]|uniref:DNA methyltransferase n=1 Tax=Longimicrobium sp. TaxID=2029185 RepID=UPI002F95DB33
MSVPYIAGGDFTLYRGDCRQVLADLPAESVDAIVCDPPYELGFMGRAWDRSGVAFDVETWKQGLRALKPGGHLLAFGGTRTYHRMACAIEDAGFEIRDQLQWLYGSGFPKSLDVSKALDKAAGAKREQVPPRSIIGHQRQIGNRRPYMDNPHHTTDSDVPVSDAAREWAGWGTALKPANEPICFARKPFPGTVAANVLKHGTGALNIDACRIATDDVLRAGAGGLLSHVRDGKPYPQGRDGEASAGRRYHESGATDFAATPGPRGGDARGRWPANVILGCACEDEHEPGCAVRLLDEQSGERVSNGGRGPGTVRATESIGYGGSNVEFQTRIYGDTGGASRFFYTAKASKAERTAGGTVDNPHPTV